MSNIEAIVKSLISEHLSISESRITPAANFERDLGADSLDAVDLVMSIEEKFDIEISDEVAETFQTFQDFMMYLNTSLRMAA